jgi:hypothetical protein
MLLYIFKEELITENHSATQAAAAAAEDNGNRLESFKQIKQLYETHRNIEIFCYHDPAGLNMIET